MLTYGHRKCYKDVWNNLFTVSSEKHLTFLQDTVKSASFFSNPLYSSTNASVAL